MKKPFTILARAAMAGALAVLAQAAHGQILYNDTTTPLGFDFNTANGTEVGNEVFLAGSATSDNITEFKTAFDFFGPSGQATSSAMADVKFYANDGPLVVGQKSPGTVLFDSGAFPLGGYTGTMAIPAAQTIDFSSSELTSGNTKNLTTPVPEDFTWTITFSGLGAGQSAGVLEYAPPTVGMNDADAWINTGSGFELQVAKTPPGGSLQFYSEIFGTAATTSRVPDSSSMPLSALAVAAGFACMRRFQRRA